MFYLKSQIMIFIKEIEFDYKKIKIYCKIKGMKEVKSYYIYILRCKDGSLYTGITTDIQRRYKEHLEKRGGRYTRAKGVLKIEVHFQCEGRAVASKIEKYIKALSREKKEGIIANPKSFILSVKKELNIEIKINKKVLT